MMQPTTSSADRPDATVDLPRAGGAPPPKEVACPVCATVFSPRATAGRCPVCGEEVVPATLVTRAVPGLTPAWAWIKAGGWRMVLVAFVVIYQVVLFIVVWQRFAAVHAL